MTDLRTKDGDNLPVVFDVHSVGAGKVLAKFVPAAPDGAAFDLSVIGTSADPEAAGNGSVVAVLKKIRALLGGVVLAGGSAVIGKVGLQTGNADVASANPLPINVQGLGYSASGKTAVSGTFVAVGASAAFSPLAGRPFNLSLWGTFAGNVLLERSFDAGTTWLPLTGGGGALMSFAAPASEQWEESEVGVQYRLRCASYISGTVNYRVSQ